MIRRFTFALVAIVTLAAALAFSQVASKPAAPAAKTAALHTPDGQPDLQGVWSTSTTVPLERPATLGAKEFYTPEEFTANAAKAGERKGKARLS